MTSSLLRSSLHALALCAALVSPYAEANGAISTDASPSATTGVRPVTWKEVPTQFVSAGGVDFAYRELGQQNGGVPVVLLVHLAGVMDNWDPRVVDGLAAKHHLIAFDNRGIGSSSGKPANTME